MEHFLKQVTEHYYGQGGIDRHCFVFPNRRSMMFFRKHLSAVVAERSQTPMFMPEMFTMNDLFYRVSGVETTDNVSLLLELYQCYKEVYPAAESLDDFIFWGQVILSDFDDVDKYLADPEKLFANVKDFREIQDTYSYLTDNQIKAINQFIRHFVKDGKLTVDLGSEHPDVKSRFLKIWNILYPLYQLYNKTLREKGLSYEGMAYRSLAGRLRGDGAESVADIFSKAFPKVDKYVFVGLNALNESEKTVMRRLRDAHLAEFCWDYSSEMIKNRWNRSSMFMSENISDFPQAFELSWEEKVPDIRVISVPSSVGQTKQVPAILQEIADRHAGGEMNEVGKLDSDGADCAIVLSDENLLIPMLNSIPSEISSINVTMGYPMGGSAFYSLMNDIAVLQLHLRQRPDGWAFYHKQVWSIFSNSIIKEIAGDDARAVMDRIKADAKYFIPEADFAGVWPFNLIFKPVVQNAKNADKDLIFRFSEYFTDITASIAVRFKEHKDMSLELEFAKCFYNAVNRLKSLKLEVLPLTYVRLLQKLVGGMSVPFRGEPLKGLQIMGPLEMRSLDFTNLIVLSCNEGVFPRKSIASSFIPPELRKGFGLPTYENQDAVWAYYFYRMIQRAENVWLLYDSRMTGLAGEESRYIKQLHYHFKRPLKHFVAQADVAIHQSGGDVIPKTEEDIARILQKNYSATSVQDYLSCPAKFYYKYVKELAAEEKVSEYLDGSMVGTVFHDTMEALYTGGEALSPDYFFDKRDSGCRIANPLKAITQEYIRQLLDDKVLVRTKIRALIKQQLKTSEVTGRNLVLENIINEYVRKTLTADLHRLQEYDRENGTVGAKFDIIGLEVKKLWHLDEFRFVGYLDRLEMLGPDIVRVVDYKTGAVQDGDIVDENNALKTAEDLFNPDVKDRPKIALQLFLYDMFVLEDKSLQGKRLQNVIYQPGRLVKGDGELSSDLCRPFCEVMMEKLRGMFAELKDPETGFRRTDNDKTCGYCDFKKLCGRGNTKNFD